MSEVNSMNGMSKQKLMNVIMKTSFALDDVKLYLDTHPTCPNALSYYERMRKVRDAALCEYEQKYEPMCQYNVYDDDVWTWNSGKMPWEGDDCACGIMKKD